MLKNYLKIALRNLLKHKAHSFINIVGLAVGIACCFFIFSYVQDELSYDRYHQKADQIYRLVSDVQTQSETNRQANTSAMMAPALRVDFPQVLSFVRFMPTEMLVRHGDNQFQEEHVFFADSSVFEVFSFSLIKGDPHTALKEPYSVVLTAKTAQKFFGEENPMGQTLIVDNELTFKVTGILAEVPRHSHFVFDMLVSFTTCEKLFPNRMNWFSFAFYTYLLLPKDFNVTVLEAKFPAFIDHHIGGQLRGYGMNYILSLQPLTKIYLHSQRLAEIGPVGSSDTLYIFSAIAVFILFIACINFMNLATARSTKRAKEVSMRKVVGAERSQLIRQFLGESILLSFLSLLLALMLFELLLPALNTLSGKELSLHFNRHWVQALVLFGLALLVGIIAGSYPAFVLSGFQPLAVLKSVLRSTGRGAVLRRSLVVFQFAISVVLIIGTVVVYMQLDYLRRQSPGFNKEQMLVIDFKGEEGVKRRHETIKRELQAHPSVAGSSFSSGAPGTGLTTWYTVVEVGGGATRESNLEALLVDYDFLNNYGIEIVAGRAFSQAHATDATEAFIINEAAVAHFGWTSPEEAIGKRIEQIGARKQGRIIGVVKDFHFESLHYRIAPLSLHLLPSHFTYLSLRIKTEEVSRTVAALKRRWEALVPNRPFEYFLLDENFDQQYHADEKFGQVFGVFAILAILIACLGLLGLASFTAEQRIKEIGIR
ncbi:MAG: ABC transporter permease, partial [bacterium]